MIQGLDNSFTCKTNIKSTLEVMMFGRGSVFLLPFYKQKEKTKDLAGRIMKLITTLIIPKRTTATFAGSKLIIKGKLKRNFQINYLNS